MSSNDPWLMWDVAVIVEAVRLEMRGYERRRGDLSEDPMDHINVSQEIQTRWDAMVDQITAYMWELKSDYWLVVAEDIGWQRLSGSRHVFADHGQDLLQKVLPPECVFSVRKTPLGLFFKAAHHDAQCEKYWVTVLSSELSPKCSTSDTTKSSSRTSTSSADLVEVGSGSPEATPA